MKILNLVPILLLAGCVGFVHQEDLIPQNVGIKIPKGSIKIEPWPRGGSLRYRAPWGLYFSLNCEKNAYDSMSLRIISIVSEVQNYGPDSVLVVEFGTNGLPIDPERTKRLIKHPGEGKPVVVTFEIVGHGNAGAYRSIHTLKFVPKLTSEVITYNPLLDIT